LSDGYFTAEAMDYNLEGWKDYLTIYVNNGQITIAEYDAKNMSGFRRSWDLDYLLEWHSKTGVPVTNYVFSYQNSLVTLQNPEAIQAIPGSRNMRDIFAALASRAIIQSKIGQKGVAYVKLPDKEYPNEL
jgi:major membrane immunogen (membrane-anchored lipoprotein)